MVFVAESIDERLREVRVCGRLKACMEKLVRFRIDSSVQPVPLSVDPDRCFIHRNLIWRPTVFGLNSALCTRL
jgi:hypothetical protein